MSMSVLLSLSLVAPVHAKKPKKNKKRAAPTIEAPAPVPPEPGAASEPAWADTPPDSWLPASGPVRGRLGSATVELPTVGLSFQVAAAGGPTLETTATLYLEQEWSGEGVGVGPNQVWIDLPASLGVGTWRSEAPARPVFAQLGTDPAGADAKNWQSAECVWVLEITSWTVASLSQEPPQEVVLGWASGRIAVMLRDAWGGTDTGFVAGTFTDLEVKAQPASW